MQKKTRLWGIPQYPNSFIHFSSCLGRSHMVNEQFFALNPAETCESSHSFAMFCHKSLAMFRSLSWNIKYPDKLETLTYGLTTFHGNASTAHHFFNLHQWVLHVWCEIAAAILGHSVVSTTNHPTDGTGLFSHEFFLEAELQGEKSWWVLGTKW